MTPRQVRDELGALRDEVRDDLAHLGSEVRDTLEALAARPALRGVSHMVAFFVAIIAGVLLVQVADRTVQVVAGLMYVAGLCLSLGASALYHRIRWSRRLQPWMQRLDHAMIFVFMAAALSALALLALDGSLRTTIVAVAWAVAIFCVTMRMSCHRLPRWLLVVAYLSLGWLALPLVPSLLRSMELTGLTLLIAGGVFYSIGALVYLFRRPNPLPRVFGFHEVFHAFTLAAAACHYGAIYGLVAQ